MNFLSVKSTVFIGRSQVYEELTVIKFQRGNDFCWSLLPAVILSSADMHFPVLAISCSQSPDIRILSTQHIHASPRSQVPVLFLQQPTRIFSFISVEVGLQPSSKRDVSALF